MDSNKKGDPMAEQEDSAKTAAEAEANRAYSDKALKWVVGLMLSVMITGGTLYGNWITESIHTNEDRTAKIIQREILRDQNLDILNSKIDVILNHYNIEYNGPTYKPAPVPDTK